MSLDWDMVAALALALPGSALTTHYGKPAVKANGRAIVGPSREPGNFVLHIDQDMKAMLIETDPDTYWQTPHYEGWPGVLVRYDSADPERISVMIAHSHARAVAMKPPKPRRK